jgi:hypothetical protein
MTLELLNLGLIRLSARTKSFPWAKV